MTDLELARKLREFRSAGVKVCLATIVETDGSTPRAPGAKMIVCADGSMFGTVGGGCGENRVRSAALRCLVLSEKPELLEIDLTDAPGDKDGAVCGGRMWIFVEPV